MTIEFDKTIGLLKYLNAGNISFEGRNLLSRMTNIHSILSGWCANFLQRQFGILCCLYGRQNSCPQLISLDRRPFIKRMFGSEIENLVYLYSSLPYDYFSMILTRTRSIYTLFDRYTNKNIIIDQNLFCHLIYIETAFQFENIIYKCENDLLSLIRTDYSLFEFFNKSKEYLPKKTLKQMLPILLKIHNKALLTEANDVRN